MRFPNLLRDRNDFIKYKHIAVLPSTVKLLYEYKKLGESWDMFLRRMLRMAISNDEEESAAQDLEN
jgi:hypothetical protein